jgi:hypothetical protein
VSFEVWVNEACNGNLLMASPRLTISRSQSTRRMDRSCGFVGEVRVISWIVTWIEMADDPRSNTKQHELTRKGLSGERRESKCV